MAAPIRGRSNLMKGAVRELDWLARFRPDWARLPSIQFDYTAVRRAWLDAPALVLGAAIAILSWPVKTELGSAGTDLSWMGPLHLAVQSGLRFGRDIAFTYGPLGFLQIPQPYYGGTSVASFAYLALVQLALCLFVARGSFRAFTWPVAIVVAYLLARSVIWIGAGSDQWHGLPEMSLVLVFLVAVARLERVSQGGTHEGARSLAFEVAAGLASGLLLLGKVNIGVFAAAVLLVTVVATDRSPARGLLRFGLSAGLGLVAWWLLAGQQLPDLPAFARLSVDIAAGYSEAMGGDGVPEIYWKYTAAAAAVGTVAILAASAARGWPRRQQAGLAAVGIIVAFGILKGGFVRWHTDLVFGAATLAAVTFLRPGSRRSLGLVAVIGLVATLAAAAAVGPIEYLWPGPQVQSFAEQMTTVATPENRAAAYARTVTGTRQGHLIEGDPETLALVTGRRVHFDPMAAAAAVGYREIIWSPLPVFQAYSVYTRTLDEMNAAALTDDTRAPEIILREPPYAIDGRNPWWEGPEATLEMLCRYREIRAVGHWEVLQRAPTRCGPGESIGTVSARTGSLITVPVETRPDRIVVARIEGVNESLAARVTTLLFRTPEWWVATRPGEGHFRLVPGTAGDGLIMSVPNSVGYSPEFAFESEVRAFTVESGTANAGEQVDLRIEFVSYPFAPDPQSTGPTGPSPRAP